MKPTSIEEIAQHIGARCLSRRAALRSVAAGAGAAVLTAATAGPAFVRPVSEAAPSTPGARATPAGAAVPATGQLVPELAAFDRVMTGLITKWMLPGAVLAVGKAGRLVFNRGYGLADREQGMPVQPTSRFRIASVSKTITTAAILTLVDAGKLALDDKVFPLLGFMGPSNAPVDPHLAAITVRDLLVHAGGWDSSKSFDPQYLPWSRMAAAAMGRADPPNGDTIVRFMVGNALDFDPGTKSVYSNFGFNVLGRVIEKVSGRSYENYVQARVLDPAGVTTMQQAGTRLEDRALGEVRYYAPAEYPPVPSVFWGDGFVPMPYGNYYLKGMDAHGGWIATAADLVRFATAIDGQRGPALLKPETVNLMLHATRPPGEGLNGLANDKPATGLGWVVQPGMRGLNWGHTGALGGGTGAYLSRTADGVTIAFIANTLPGDFVGFLQAVTQTLPATAGQIGTWPSHDLFTQGT